MELAEHPPATEPPTRSRDEDRLAAKGPGAQPHQTVGVHGYHVAPRLSPVDYDTITITIAAAAAAAA